MLLKNWAFGDRVVHAGRPEWGVGVVTSAVPEQHEGRSCQKLGIRFERAGLKTISTAHADLRPEGDMPMLTAKDSNPENDPLKAPLGPSSKEIMLRIPDVATDPFTTPKARLDATINLYKFSDQGGSLLDWAAMQSGLKDPMTRFSRHELEDLFKRWMMLRDDHLKRLCLEIKRNDPGLIAEAARNAPRGVQQLLRRFDVVR